MNERDLLILWTFRTCGVVLLIPHCWDVALALLGSPKSDNEEHSFLCLSMQ